MLGASMRWRRAYGCPVDPSPIAHQLALGTVFTAGADYEGHPVLYHFGPGVGPNASPQQVALAARAAVYWMEKAVAKSPDGKVVVVVVRDLTAPKGGGLNKLAYPRELAKILELNFPESLAKAVIVPADGWFRGLWGVASRFVDAKTRSKIHLLPDHRDLLKHVPYQELLAHLGGGSRHRFSLADVEGLPKEWGEYHQRQQHDGDSHYVQGEELVHRGGGEQVVAAHPGGEGVTDLLGVLRINERQDVEQAGHGQPFLQHGDGDGARRRGGPRRGGCCRGCGI